MSRLLDTQAAFDSVAADYDGPLGNNELIQYLRDQTRQAVVASLAPAGSLLDLGCGTGLDAEYFARAGFRVTALDWSPEMVRRTRERIARATLSDRVSVMSLGIHQLGELPGDGYSGAYSNLGPLNCAPDLAEAGASLHRKLAPGGVVVASVIGRFCPWEIGLFALKGDWSRATFRLKPEWKPAPLNHHRVWTRYYRPAELSRIMTGVGFRLCSVRALGLFVPPPYLQAWAGRHPALIKLAKATEAIAGRWPGLRDLGDHFLIVLKKV